MAFGLKRAAAPLDLRSGDRRDMVVSTVVLLMNGDRVEAELRNVSTSGFLAIIDADLPEGKMFRVRLGNGRMRHARVVRANEPEYGCAFLEPIGEGEALG